MNLPTLLKAKRPDLLDGFPFKAALKALSAHGNQAFKLSYLNDILAKDGIEVSTTTDGRWLLPGFKEAGIAGALTYSDGSIEVKVNRAFFKVSGLTPFERALRFQSITLHELVHREQFTRKTLHAMTMSDEELSTVEYMNDPHELEAMAAEIAHDSITSQFAAALPAPRFADVTAHAAQLTPESMDLLRKHVAGFRV